MSLGLLNASTWVILLVVELSSLRKIRQLQCDSFQLLRRRKLYVFFRSHRLLPLVCRELHGCRCGPH